METIQSKPGTMLVRVRAFAPRQGHTLRRFRAFGIEFRVGHGWYEVPTHVAEYLATVHMRDGAEGSPLAFDVCTAQKAAEIEKNEQELAKVRAANAAAPRIVRMDPSTAAEPTVASPRKAAAPAQPTPPPAPPAPDLTTKALPKTEAPAPARKGGSRRRVVP